MKLPIPITAKTYAPLLSQISVSAARASRRSRAFWSPTKRDSRRSKSLGAANRVAEPRRWRQRGALRPHHQRTRRSTRIHTLKITKLGPNGSGGQPSASANRVGLTGPTRPRSPWRARPRPRGRRHVRPVRRPAAQLRDVRRPGSGSGELSPPPHPAVQARSVMGRAFLDALDTAGWYPGGPSFVD